MGTCKLCRIERQRHGCHGRAVAWRSDGWALCSPQALHLAPCTGIPASIGQSPAALPPRRSASPHGTPSPLSSCHDL